MAVPQRLKPYPEQDVYRSGEPLRRPKSRATAILHFDEGSV
jgi:hypothetical protein